MRSFQFGLIVQLSIIVISHAVFVSAQDRRGKEESNKMGGSKGGVDRVALIDALANRNPVPKLVGNDRVIPIFDKNYDWSEDRRVWGKAIPDVITHIEDVSPETAKKPRRQAVLHYTWK